VLVLLDNVQFPRRSYVNRVQVKTAQGAHWLTQPVQQRGRYDQRIRDVEFSEGDWVATHLATLQANYGRAPHFRSHFTQLMDQLQYAGSLLVTCNERLIRWLCEVLELRTRVLRASDLVDNETDPTQRLIRLVQAVGGDTYISGQGGFNYQELTQFKASGIRVLRAPSSFPEYSQLWGSFAPGLSVVDALFNLGPECRAYLDQPMPMAR
jgi:hypothetical protein